MGRSWEKNLGTYEQTSMLLAMLFQIQKLEETKSDTHGSLKALLFFDPKIVPSASSTHQLDDHLAKQNKLHP